MRPLEIVHSLQALSLQTDKMFEFLLALSFPGEFLNSEVVNLSEIGITRRRMHFSAARSTQYPIIAGRRGSVFANVLLLYPFAAPFRGLLLVIETVFAMDRQLF